MSGGDEHPRGDGTRTKRQAKAAATRSQLLEAARRVFEDKGYQATTVGAITERGNTAHGTFYLHFRNKEHCFCEVMTDLTEQMYDEAGARWEAEPYAGIRAATRGFLTLFTAHAGLWPCLLEGMLQSPEIEQLWLGLRRRFTERIAHVMAAEQDLGHVRTLDADLSAEALTSMAEWYAFTRYVVGAASIDAAGVEEGVEVLANLWYHAVYGHAPA